MSLPNFTIQQGCGIRKPRCQVFWSFFCSTSEDDSRLSISLIINSLSNKKTTPSIVYCGYTLYDWIDIIIQTRSIDKKLDFEDRYLGENFDSQHFIKNRYEILKITDQIDSALLLHLTASSLKGKSMHEVRIELFVRTDLTSHHLLQRFGSNKLWPVSYDYVSKRGKPQLWYRKLNWNAIMRFSRSNIFHIVSLPGKYDKVSLKLEGTVGYENLTFRAQWLHDIYQKYESSIHKEPESCTDLPTMTFRYEFCINYNSSKIYGKKTYLLFKQFFLYKVNLSTIDGISWSEALEVCSDSGGFLPAFGSRDELHEVLSIFRLSRYLKPVVAIYIGINKVGEMCETKL